MLFSSMVQDKKKAATTIRIYCRCKNCSFKKKKREREMLLVKKEMQLKKKKKEEEEKNRHEEMKPY